MKMEGGKRLTVFRWRKVSLVRLGRACCCLQLGVGETIPKIVGIAPLNQNRDALGQSLQIVQNEPSAKPFY